jgi:hypothetical protein
MNQLLEINVFPDDFQSSPSARRDLGFVEFGLRSLKHIVAKSPFAIGHVLAVNQTATVRELFVLDSPTVLVLAYRFVRLLHAEEAGYRFMVETPMFAAVCGTQMDAIMPNIAQFLAGSFFADDPALLTTVIRAMFRVLIRTVKNGRAKRQWIAQFLQDIVPQLKEMAEAAGEPILTMI